MVKNMQNISIEIVNRDLLKGFIAPYTNCFPLFFGVEIWSKLR